MTTLAGLPLWALLFVLVAVPALACLAAIAQTLEKMRREAHEDRARIADEMKQLSRTMGEIAFTMEQTMHTPETRAKMAELERFGREWRRSQEAAEASPE